MARRSTLELLRVLRKREKESQGRALSRAAQENATRVGVARLTDAKHAAARSERDGEARSEQESVDRGATTAGALSRNHGFHRDAERRLVELHQTKQRAAEDAARSLARKTETAFGLARATAAEARVEDHVARADARALRADEQREEDAAADVRNSKAALGRSREHS